MERLFINAKSCFKHFVMDSRMHVVPALCRHHLGCFLVAISTCREVFAGSRMVHWLVHRNHHHPWTTWIGGLSQPFCRSGSHWQGTFLGRESVHEAGLLLSCLFTKGSVWILSSVFFPCLSFNHASCTKHENSHHNGFQPSSSFWSHPGNGCLGIMILISMFSETKAGADSHASICLFSRACFSLYFTLVFCTVHRNHGCHGNLGSVS